jgi:quercetin dioxygenase-like cupin family protein
MPDHAFVPDLAAEVEIPRDGILSRTIFESPRVKAILFGFDAGQELSAHTAELVLGEERLQGSRGTWVHMPAGQRHAVHATTPLRMLLLLLPDPA